IHPLRVRSADKFFASKVADIQDFAAVRTQRATDDPAAENCADVSSSVAVRIIDHQIRTAVHADKTRNFDEQTCLFPSFPNGSIGFAQRLSGELRLRVTDPTGGGIRAIGTIVGQATGVDHAFETDENGRFTLRGLPLGKYGLTIQSEGFSKKVEVVEINSQLPLEHLVMLEIVPLATTIDVRAVDTLLDPERTAAYLPHSALEELASAAPN